MPTTTKSTRRVTAKTTTAVPGEHAHPPAPAKPRLTNVRVRMFRQGLGDCMLLTFDPEGDARHVLIDCGTLGAKTTGVGLAQVATEIATTVGAKGIDLLIATHEHWDHVAGFAPTAGHFAPVKVKRVWLAWTENPADPDAQTLARDKSDLGIALRAALTALRAAPAADERSATAAAAVTDVLGFMGVDGGGLGVDGVSDSLNAAMNAVRTGFGAPVVYREPGDKSLEHDWLKGFRIYVLGPPRDRAALKRVGEHGSSEIYGISPGVRAALARFKPDGVSRDDVEAEMPFAARCREPMAGDEARKWYQGYLEGDDWRRIDGDWLHAAGSDAEQLALQLDNLTNNTSLALAIERVADGKVLLFPADAQEGSWLSWHDPAIRWKVPNAAGVMTEVTAAELLHRTVFYKVGHHGSHNATASAKGLELMPGTGLTAFIPVDRQVALNRNPKGSWRMPARALYRRLLEKCEGRVVRSDIGWAAPVKKAKPADTEKEFESLATDAEWEKWQKAQSAAAHVRVTPTYIEFMLE